MDTSSADNFPEKLDTRNGRYKECLLNNVDEELDHERIDVQVHKGDEYKAIRGHLLSARPPCYKLVVERTYCWLHLF